METVAVQHHHAHLAACLAEHGETGPAVGAIYDGTGYGSDGTVWGGELLAGDLAGFERAGHLWPVRLPGGDRAVRQPWRMACAWLLEAGWDGPLPGPDRRRGEQVAELVRTGLSSPVTTSMGRLFDAVAALCGLRAEVTYEGQAAIELEAAADPAERGAYELPVTADGVLDARPAVLAVARRHGARRRPGVVSARFHAAVADATAEACAPVAGRAGLPSCCRAACSRTARCWRRPRAGSRRAACACSCPSGCPAQRRRGQLRPGGGGGGAGNVNGGWVGVGSKCRGREGPFLPLEECSGSSCGKKRAL